MLEMPFRGLLFLQHGPLIDAATGKRPGERQVNDDQNGNQTTAERRPEERQPDGDQANEWMPSKAADLPFRTNKLLFGGHLIMVTIIC